MLPSSEQFLETIKLTFFDPNDGVRSHNEEFLTQFMSNNPNEFVSLCTSLFNDEAVISNLRQTTATVLKLALKPTKGNEKMSIWLRLSDDSKLKVRESGLRNLIDDSEIIKNSAASLIADVFALDCMTDRQWGDLLNNLIVNLTHKDPNIQRSAIMTLGYICEVIHREGIRSLTSEQLDAMMTGICLGLKQYDDKTLTALKALEYSLEFLMSSIGSETVSDFIMSLLITIQIKATEEKNEEIIRQNLLCLGEICKLIYGNFQKYHTVVFTNVLNAFDISNKNVLIAASEFFQTFFNLEAFHKTNYLEQFVVLLLEKCLQGMLTVLPGELDNHDADEQIEFQNSLLYLMSSINSIYTQHSFEPLIHFIKVYIDLDSLSSKCVALTALESLCEAPATNEIYDMLFKGFLGVTQQFAGPNLRLKLQSGSILSKMAKYYPAIFLEDQNFKSVFPVLIHQLEQSDRSFAIAGSVCSIFDNLSSNSQKVPSNCLTNLVGSQNLLLEKLLNTLESPNLTLYFVDTVYSTIMSIISNITPSESYSKWFEVLWRNFEAIKESTAQNELCSYKMDSIFVNLNMIIQLLVSQNKGLELGDNKQEGLKIIYIAVTDIFRKHNEIRSEPLLFLISLIELEPQFFHNSIDHVMKEFLAKVLQQSERKDLFEAGIHSVGHLVKIYESNMSSYVMDLLPLMMNSLEDSHVQKETKRLIFMTVADIGAHCPSAIISHLPKIIKLLQFMFSAVVQLQQTPSKEKNLYCNSLKETIVDLSACLIHGIYYDENIKEQSQYLEEFFPELVNFLRQNSSDSNQGEHLDFLKDVCCLLMDIYIITQDFQYVDKPMMHHYYTQLDKYSHLNSIQTILTDMRTFVFQGDPRLN